MLEGENLKLRLLQLKDLDFLYSVENNKSYFKFSSHPQYYSKEELKEFISNSTDDITIYNQLRFVVDLNDKPIGLIDLFNYNPKRKNAGVGIIILEEFQNQNFGSKSLELLIAYAWEKLDLLSLYANIKPNNQNSIKLFNKHGFVKKSQLLFELNK